MRDNQVSGAFTLVTMEDMSKEIDITHALVDEYPGAEIDLAVFLVQGYFKRIVEKLGPDDKMLLGRALAYAKWYANRRLTQDLHDLIDRSTMFMLNEAENSGWYRELEYDNLTEFLASIYESKEGMTEAYDWRFIVEKLVPAAEQAGVPIQTMMGASLQVKKLRGLVPATRELFARQEAKAIPPEEAQETLTNWLKEVANPKVTFSCFKEDIDAWRGRSVDRAPAVQGYQILMPDGRWWVVVPTGGDAELAMVQQALRTRVDIKISNLSWLVKWVETATKGKVGGNGSDPGKQTDSRIHTKRASVPA